MAQIDELIAAMQTRRADALILASNQPAQLSFGGVLASGASVPAHLLREMLREIIPVKELHRLHHEGAFEFSYACGSGLMLVQVERHGFEFHVVVAPYSSPRNSASPKPSNARGSSSAFRTHGSTFSAPLPRASVSTGNAKPTMDWSAVFFATMLFCFALGLFVNFCGIFGFAGLLTIFTFAAFAILLDSYLVGVQPGLVDGAGDCGPWTWFFVCVFFGFIGIPAYLVMRPIYQRALLSMPIP